MRRFAGFGSAGCSAKRVREARWRSQCRTSSSYKVAIVQEDSTEGKDSGTAEMDPRYLEDVRVAHKAGDGQSLIANDAEIIGVKNQPIIA